MSTTNTPNSISSSNSIKPGILANLKYDIPSGLVVFLVALPLCLGIALASGAPLFSGIISGIVGGVVIGYFSGSQVSVSGPAAGLTVIVLDAIISLGDFQIFLMAVVLSGVIQFIFGVLKGGIVGDYVPTSVIKGMLAAIGIVIFLKQIPHALGWDKDYEGDMSFFTATEGGNTFSDILVAIHSFSPGAVTISVLSLIILILWEQPFIKSKSFSRLISGPLVVVVLGISLNSMFGLINPGWQLLSEDGHLVSLPVASSLGEFLQQFTIPNFASIVEGRVWAVAITIAIIGSIETLLSIEASDKLDPFKRISDSSKELRAQGIGNFISGLIGGLPATSVIVRSSANVYSGSRTKVSAIFHGLLLLFSVLLIPSLLNLIPLATLSAILLVIGYKLAKISLFKQMYEYGTDTFIPFLVTVLAIVFTDLLIGIGIGLLVGIFFVIKSNHHRAISSADMDGMHLISFNKDMTFVNKNELKHVLRDLPSDISLIIDGTKAKYIDHDIQDILNDFIESSAYKNISISLKNISNKHNK